MPPPLPAEPQTSPAPMGLGNPSQPRQRTLDMFLGQSGGRSRPSALPQLAPPRKTSTAQPASRPSFAVVLNSSPSKQAKATIWRTVEDDADDLMTSGFSPQFRKSAPQAAPDVSLAKPALPTATIDEPDASSPGTDPLPPPRKRGRPKGFQPNRAGTETLQDESRATGPRKLRPDRPKTGAMYAGKRRGRPPKAPSPQPRTIYEGLNPHFNVFICEWKGCSAELHNFATLRKHVVVVHARTEPFACQWAQCAEQPQRPAHSFPTSADLRAHLEDSHMLPIAWQVGDGPQVSFKRYATDDGAELPGRGATTDGGSRTFCSCEIRICRAREKMITGRRRRRKSDDATELFKECGVNTSRNLARVGISRQRRRRRWTTDGEASCKCQQRPSFAARFRRRDDRLRLSRDKLGRWDPL